MNSSVVTSKARALGKEKSRTTRCGTDGQGFETPEADLGLMIGESYLSPEPAGFEQFARLCRIGKAPDGTKSPRIIRVATNTPRLSAVF
jgi:hypothetical protein